MIQDQNIAWIRKRIFLDARKMLGTLDDGSSGIPALAATSATREAEVAALGITGWTMSTNGEILNGLVRIPDLDPSFEMGYKILYTVDVNSNAPTITWKAFTGVVLADAIYAVPATALDTPIAADVYPSATDSLMVWTSRGIDKLLPVTRVQLEAGAMLALQIEMDTATQSPTDVIFLGLEVDYVPQKMEGQGSHTDRPLASV